MTTTTSTTTTDYIPQHMHSSISSLSSSQQQPPNVARTYKQAFDLFITRQTSDALDVLEQIIRPPDLSDAADTDEEKDNAAARQAPVASASRAARVKVWTLYALILNAIVDLGPEEGRRTIGKGRWKELVAKTRDGVVWEEVVRDGYSGLEGNVDAEVVAQLATLLIAHAPSQKLTQQRLEAYLAVSSTSTLDTTSHTEGQDTPLASIHANGAGTPRDLKTRQKILEIYTLHVLPRNGEWDYAREFLSMSEVLDEERRDAFLQTLQALKDQGIHDAERERELQRRREREIGERTKRQEDERRAQEAKDKAEQEQEQSRPIDTGKTTTQNEAQERKLLDQTPKTKPSSKPPETSKGPQSSANGTGLSPRPARSSGPAKKSRSPPPTLYRRASLSLQAIQQSLMQMGRGLSKHPMALLRTVLFVIALLMALARRDVRDRLNHARGAAWDKIRRTVGMGVKVTYI